VGMKNVIEKFPEQFRVGISAAKDIKPKKEFRRVICCGMGGSIIPGEILSIINEDVVIHWNYGLPNNANSDDLVICTSWSGNTEETISSYEKAVSLNIEVIAITKGGKLAEKVEKNGTQLILLPDEKIMPRTAVGYMVGAMFKVLNMEDELNFNLDAEALEEEGKNLASKIGNRIPLIYTSYPLRKMAGFWKILFNENAKIHAFANWFPSAAHNEIAGFNERHKDTFTTIVFRADDEDARHAKNLDALLEILGQIGYNYNVVKLASASTKVLERIFNNYLLGLWTSYYLAELLGTNAENVELIESFKQLKA
jgi:glucose/mannose-6-phosphate isomerase